MAPLKILIWCPLVNLGGGARLLAQLSEAIARQPDVELVRLIAGASHNLNLRGETPVEVIELAQKAWLDREGRILGIRGTGRLKQSLRDVVRRGADERLAQLRQTSQDCDVVYVFWPHRQAFLQLEKPVVCTFQDATFFDFPEILGAETSAEWQRSAVWLRESTEVVVSSHATRTALVRHFGPHCERATVIHHAILPAKLDGREVQRTALVTSLPHNYVVCPATVTTHKNHYALLIAWSRFARRREYPLVLLGPGTQEIMSMGPKWSGYWQYDRISGVAARSGLRLKEDWYALGYVADDEVMPLVSNAAALIMPTLSEGGGSYPVEEALSVGTPVLCSDIPVMREHIGGRSAKIAWFDPESPDSIVCALDHLFDYYDDYKRSTLAAMSDPRPAWDDIAAQYVRVFQRAVRSGSKAPTASPVRRP
ncbi:MAG: hypothetical protein HONDAALG_02378 [Gammaproteobacteria bacterium]|nr:hypothetical protein [Gammaproteobacteria bacterium]